MQLASIAYSPLLEEEDFSGWDKETARFALEHPKKVLKKIKAVACKLNKRLTSSEADDIYQLTLEDIFKKDDYNPDKTEELTVETYVYNLAKNCTLRFMTDCKKREQLLVENVQKEEDGKEVSIFDNMADTRDEDIFNYTEDITLEYVCKANEHNRYMYGPDVFLVWTVQLLVMIHNKNSMRNQILGLLGISESDLTSTADYKDTIMCQIAKEVSKIGPEKALEVISKYTFAFKQIERVVLSI